MFRAVALLLCAGVVGAQQNQDPRELLKQAIEAQQSGDFDKSVSIYNNLIAAYPRIPELHSNLGAALSAQGLYNQAIDEYQKALAIKSDPQVRLNLALAYYKAGEIASAVTHLRQAHTETPGNLQVVTVLADCYLRLGRDADVIELLTPAQEASPDDATFQYLLGTALVRHGDAGKGQIVIDRILKHGDSAEARLLMGTTKYVNGDYPGARQDLQKALNLNPNLPDVFAYYGLSLLATDDQAGAQAAFEKELLTNPNDFESNLRLGAILRTEDRKDEALKYLRHALQLRPGDPAPRYQIASIQLANGQLEEAKKELEALVKTAPDFIEAHVSLATVYFRLKRKEDGNRERQIVSELTAIEQKRNEKGARQTSADNTAEATFQAGVRKFDAADYPAAVAQFAAAAKLNPVLPQLQSHYGQALLYTGDPDGAVRAFTQELAADPSDFDSHLGLARILNARKQFSQALPHARRAVELRSQAAPAKLELAQALAGTGDMKQARIYAEDAAAAMPRFAHAHRLLSRVYQSLQMPAEAAREDKLAASIEAMEDPGPAPGDLAPDFELSAPKTKLSSYRDKSPVVLIFGSYTCPNFRAAADSLKSLEKQYGSRARFLLVYIREAHASDSWQSTRGDSEDASVKPAASMSEKQDHAAMCIRKLQLPFPVLVDGMDGAVEAAYHAWPSRAYIIDKNGRVEYTTRLTELDFHADKMEAALRHVIGAAPVSTK